MEIERPKDSERETKKRMETDNRENVQVIGGFTSFETSQKKEIFEHQPEYFKKKSLQKASGLLSQRKILRASKYH